ncbi:cadherin-like beta sandwich domain-containing protein [Clostridium sp.]|uniref:N-acetylmuramoyl-L-alanine amidase family protein n=1 Tax=Clostridium sp. TaxID=1506 RepID=UPI00260E82D6|nr:cadherin-like beta sandwich domain-containing protein [Clostridium sp.]
MSKTKKKFIGLLVVFTSIVSFLPVGFSGQAARADDVADATTVRVNVTGENTQLTSTVDPTTNETIYSTTDIVTPTKSQPDKGFDITVKDVIKSIPDLEVQAKGNGKQANSATGVVAQGIQIVSINDVAITDTASLTDLGLSCSDITGTGLNGENVIGKRIVGLSLGINEISYKVTYQTQTVTYTPTLDPTTQQPTGSGTFNDGSPVDHASSSNSNMTIEQATTFVTQQITSLLYKSYVGKVSDFGPNDEISNDKNNEPPFLYTQAGEPDANMPLRYNFNVPDSTNILKYVINFKQDLTNAQVYKNGVKDTGINITNNSLEGNLNNLGDSALLVLKIGGIVGDETIAKSYAIEMKYNGLDASKDYSIQDAGITKLDYNDDDSVEAYIGKKFTTTKNSAGFSVYSGQIYIDPRARMISMDPKLVKDQSTVAYVVTNNYKDSTGTTKVEKSQLKDGKQFVDFQAGAVSNQIQVDVYAGSNGSITDSSQILARYLLDVVPVNSNSNFTMNLAFTNSAGQNLTLTQPGVKSSVLSFDASRRTYDLYYNGSNPINVAFTGHRSDQNEYIRVYLGDYANSNNTTEAAASIANTYSYDSASGEYLRNTSLSIDVGKSQKMVIQAYYDKFEDKTLADGTTTKVFVGSYPVGDSYIFYLPENGNGSTTPTTGEDSTNALLNSLKISGYTLTSSDGTSGFSSDKLDYTTTVAKGDTTEKLTVIPQDYNVQSIVASVDGSSTTYSLASGVASEIPLNSSGTTTITIVVTAQDGTTTKTYTVVVKNNSKGSDANLKNVVLNPGDYTFDSTADITKVRVDPTVSNISVTPMPDDSKSTVTVNGQEYTDTAISVSLKGAQKTEISIEVTSEDGTVSKTYTLEVYRVDATDWNNTSSGSDNTDDQYYDEYNDCWIDLTKYDEWGSVNGKPAYFDKNHRQVKDAWISTGGKYYYLNNLGFRASGWKVDDTTGQTYYLDQTTGEMKKGWINLNNTWYYLGKNGIMKKGWLYLNGKWYYFTPNGQMVVNQSMYVDDKVYNFGQDGAVQF